ncbi:ABC transporter permease [Anaerolentibacter hominis]|uniref:ABC transporter permease n=1 Tax=Anaerolentibacter hominis TaxID=3079009 RepID=UPI0031B86136
MNKVISSLSDTYTMVLRSMRHTVRHVEILIMTAVLPLAQLLLLVYVIGGAMQVGGYTYLEYVLPGILLMAVASSASMTAISVKEDMSNGIIDRFRTMDIGKSAVLNGHMAATLVRTAITAGIILAVALLIGFRPDLSLTNGLLVFVILFLFSLMYTWASILWGLVCPSLEAVGAFTYMGMLLPYTSSCFVPVETMPAVLGTIAKYQPFTPLAESLRGLLLGSDTGNNILIAVAWCVGLLIVFHFFAVRAYHKRAR